jgi:metal-responsive CopG/Arc/MetJ family transcriptional regulator
MKTVISLPKSLFKAADELAQRLGVSRDELYATAIESYIRAHHNEAVTEALNRICGEEDSSLDSTLAALQSSAIRGDDWQF